MSKFIKFLPVIVLAVLVTACCCSAPERYEIHIDELYTDKSGNLTLAYRLDYTVNKDEIQKFAKFNTDTYKWETTQVTKNVIADEEITTVKGKTIVKNGDGALFEQPVPSISDIESQTDILLPNPKAFYEYFRSGKDYCWDRKTIIANVGINKEVIDGDYKFTEIHSFLFEYDEINSLWNIKHLKEIAADREYYYYYDSSNVLDTIRQQLFVNSDISLCHRQASDEESAYIYNNSLKCLVKYENGEVSLQKLYGEIMPAEYSATIKKIYDSTDFPTVYFDKNQNLYAFYNNTDEAKGKYFYFEMYKPDQPTIAQHKQKIYW